VVAPLANTSNRAKAAVLARAVERYAEEAARQTVRTLVANVSRRHGQAPGAAVASGELRGSVRVTMDRPAPLRAKEKAKSKGFYSIVGDAEVDRAMSGWKLGRMIYVTMVARHARVIEGGRRTAKAAHVAMHKGGTSVVVRSRWIGSKQNPHGFFWLAVAETKVVMLRWRPRRGGA
jgi:hypothetical protein